MLYECVLCNEKINIKVYTQNKESDFVCPACLNKKWNVRCSTCDKIFKIYPNDKCKCFNCLKKEIINV